MEKLIDYIKRNIDARTVRVSGIDWSDAPDFVDAYVESACFKDGTPLSERELGVLMNEGGYFVADLMRPHLCPHNSIDCD